MNEYRIEKKANIGLLTRAIKGYRWEIIGPKGLWGTLHTEGEAKRLCNALNNGVPKNALSEPMA